MATNVIARELERQRQQRANHTASTGPPPEPPPIEDGRRHRHRREEKRVVRSTDGIVTFEQAREVIREAMATYVALDHPTHKLLIKVPPGVGKTTEAVRLAERVAMQGKRVLYCGPRHDFFQDILDAASRKSWWYEWLPRQEGDEATKKDETCRYPMQIKTFFDRGYDEGHAFCERVCGWDYVNNLCVFHAQKKVRHPIIYAQHQHITSGHPLLDTIDVIIGDESPIGVFPREWTIPIKHIIPDDMDLTDPFTELLYHLRDLAESGGAFEGPELFAALGGATHVLDVTPTTLNLKAEAVIPRFHRADDVEQLDYFHLPALATLLRLEAAEVEAGREYLHRIVVKDRELRLYLRRELSAALRDKPTVWLDATANEHLYRTVTGWQIEVVEPKVALRGRIFQVWNSANTKTSLVKNKVPTAKAERIIQQIERIIHKQGYDRSKVAVMTYQALSGMLADYIHGHFFAARGTNRFEACEALIVIGTPQPSTTELLKQARMLFWERMPVFQEAWTDKDITFDYISPDGRSWSIPASGWWGDADLEALLWQNREAEIIQTAHRVRPVLYEKDVWLLLNLPIDELPPDELISIQELFGAPEGVDPYRWPEIVAIARQRAAERGFVTAADFVDALGCKRDAANRYVDCLIEQFPDDFPRLEVRGAGRGRPPKAAGHLPDCNGL